MSIVMFRIKFMYDDIPICNYIFPLFSFSNRDPSPNAGAAGILGIFITIFVIVLVFLELRV